VLAAEPTALEPAGVVVEEVGKGSAGEKAGIREGDVLLRWVRHATAPANPSKADGTIESSFALKEIEIEQAPRGRVELSGMRAKETFSVAMPAGDWKIQARPRMSAAGLSLYREGLKLAAEKKPDAAIVVWRRCAAEIGKTDTASAAWVLQRAADTSGNVKKWDEAHSLYREALEASGTPPDPRIARQLWTSIGETFEKHDESAIAESAYREALAISQAQFPDSLAVASNLTNLGTVFYDRGDLVVAGDYYRKALAIREKLAPESLECAGSLTNVGNVAEHRRDLATAEASHRKALAIREKLAPGSLRVAGSLNNLGLVAQDRGDLIAAEDLYRRSLEIKGKLAPESLTYANSLSNLGTCARHRGDYSSAEDLQTKALAIRERLAPGSLLIADSLNNLGNAAHGRGDLKAAEDLHRKALAIREKLGPGSLEVASTFNNLGAIALERGDVTGSAELYRKALDIKGRIAPASLEFASTLTNLGGVDIQRHDFKAAEGFLRQAQSIYERFALGDAAQAEMMHQLGLLYRMTDRLREASDAFRGAIEAIESQKAKLGGSEDSRTGFAAQYSNYYRDYIEVLLELNRRRDAFQILERSKAQSLLSMLAERDLVFASDIPADLERERKLTDAEYDEAQNQFGELSPQNEAKQIDELLLRLRELRAKQDGVAERIKKASPRLASLQYPQPLDLAGTQKALDPETVLLAYSVGKEKSFLFVVQPQAKDVLSVHTLPIGEQTLRESVEAYRNLIELKGPPGQAPAQNLIARGRSLYDTLIKPAEKQIGKSERILILPDGPLHTLPFDALVREVGAGQPRYLVEWKSLHTAVSATVYAELKKERRAAPSSAAVIVAAFGDPKYPKLSARKPAAKRSDDEAVPAETVETSDEVDEEGADPQVRSAVRGGYKFDPLPASRQEVESIATLYAPRATKYLGEEATEEKAKALGKDTPYIHFACHGILNERFPLDSALALTIPEKPKEGQDNGLLQAWEIFEKVRIDADLVTLSACETGLGKEMGGEGLVGLTRAFQYAGARSILASLWKVDDRSTAELMKRLYTYLKAGKTKDEALRLAQLDLIHSPSLAAPFHWAAFQLIGDWK
jgi:CHAT domain-containing protein/Tfp pilus assembly protein PilF